MNQGIYFSTIGRVMRWAQARSLWTFSTGPGCCADEFLQSIGCKYDLERFGCVEQGDPKHSDLLIVTGLVNEKASEELKSLYSKMLEPRYVLALGACACSGGAYQPDEAYSTLGGVQETIPVDVFVAGCPPRPEAIMDGLIRLQEKIVGTKRDQKLIKSHEGALIKETKEGPWGGVVYWIQAASLYSLSKKLKDEEGYDWLENLAVSQLDKSLVLTLFLRSRNHPGKLTLRSTLEIQGNSDIVSTRSLRDLFPSVTLQEREFSDLYGIRFLEAPKWSGTFESDPNSQQRLFVPNRVDGFPMRRGSPLDGDSANRPNPMGRGPLREVSPRPS